MGAKLERCTGCGGFVAKAAKQCPHCSRAVGSTARGLRLRALGGALGGGAIAFTLMACYGVAPPPHVCADGSPDCLNKPQPPPPPAGSATPSQPLGADAGK